MYWINMLRMSINYHTWIFHLSLLMPKIWALPMSFGTIANAQVWRKTKLNLLKLCKDHQMHFNSRIIVSTTDKTYPWITSTLCLGISTIRSDVSMANYGKSDRHRNADKNRWISLDLYRNNPIHVRIRNFNLYNTFNFV